MAPVVWLSVIAALLQGITAVWTYFQNNPSETRKVEHFVIASMLLCGSLISATSSIILYQQSQRPQMDIERIVFHSVKGGNQVRLSIRNRGNATARAFHGVVVLDALEAKDNPAAIAYSETEAASVMDMAPQAEHTLSTSGSIDPEVIKRYIGLGYRLYAKGSVWYTGAFRKKTEYPFCYLLTEYDEFEIRDGKTCSLYKGGN